MLSLSNGGMSAGQAGQYFAKEDYYLKGGESSQWLGRGAEELTLRGKVNEAAFRNLAAGKTPDGLHQLVSPKITRDKDGSQVENHRAGNDLTFSAPKSVSIGYAAGSQELKEIWDRAVVNTMRYVEKHYSQYRTPQGVSAAGNIVAAKFDHVTSRALDPEVHSHVFLVNMVHAAGGEWQANEPKNIYTDKMAIGMLARQEAINLYLKAGYQVYFSDREQLLFEIRGVRKEEIEAFSKRRAAIVEKVSKWKEEKRYPGASEAVLKQMAALDTRDPKRRVAQEDVRQAWDRGFAEAGTSALEVKARIDATRELAVQLSADKEASTVLKEASGFITDKEVVFDRAQLLQTAARISGGQHDIEGLDAAVSRQNRFHFLGREPHGWQAGREYYTTRDMLRLEAENVADLKALEPLASVTCKEEVEAYLKGLAGEREAALTAAEMRHMEAFRTGAASAARTGPSIVSAGQREHIVNELAGSGGFAVTQGDPGTGKTFAAGVVERFNAEVLEPAGRRHCTLNVAYTGKAALEMEQASGKTAYTVDALLNLYGGSRDPVSLLGLGQAAPGGTQVAIKVDEASFVGGRQAKQMLDAVRDLRARGYQVKLSLVGDTKQMQSIQASPFFSHATELARKAYGDFAVMKEITRQKDAGLLEVAKVLNRERPDTPLGTNASDALKMLQQQGRVVEQQDRVELVRSAVEHYLREAAQPSRDPVRAAAGERQSVLVVTPLNTDRQDLNAWIRQARQQNGELGRSERVEVLVPVDQGGTVASYRPGMIIVITGANGREGTMKAPDGTRRNQRGEIRSVHTARNTVEVAFGGGQQRVQTEVFDALELARGASLYRREQREMAQGDRIVFGKNTRDRSIEPADGGKKRGVRNGERGEIEKLSRSGDGTVALVRLTDGRKVNVNLDRYGPQHLEYGYAVTVHKGQGETVESVISFNYVRPACSNEKNALTAATGIQVSAEQFERWNDELSEYEKGYRCGTRIGEHTATLSFVMISDQQNARLQKGIAVSFYNGRAVIEDEAIRLQMREAGMYWSRDAESWVTAATNDSALRLMTEHPLRDQRYLARLAESLQREHAPEVTTAPTAGERNYSAAIDSGADAARFGRASYNSFNVAITRARHEAMVFTNSVTSLRRAIQTVDMKTTTIGDQLQVGRVPLRPRREPAVKAVMTPPAPAIVPPGRALRLGLGRRR